MALSRIDFFRNLVEDKYIILLDQVLLSVINFGAILLLSKIAGIGVFSDFVVTYSYSYFIFIFATYFLSAPILVFLSKKWQIMQGSYLMVCLVLNVLINILFSFILFYFLKQQVLDIQFLPFFMLSGTMSVFDILKKFVFSSNLVRVKYGLYANIILNLLFFSCIFLYMNRLNLFYILSIYGIAFGIGSVYLIVLLIKQKIIAVSDFAFKIIKRNFIKNVIQTHFDYSKWIILGGIAFWGYSQGIYILAKYYLIDDLIIGKVRTIQNLLGVFSILLIALENYYTPIFSKKAMEGTILDIENLIYKLFKENYLKILGLFALSIPVGLGFYNFMYFDKYGTGVIVFLLFLLIQLLLLMIRPFGIALKSIENTVPFFVSHLVAGVGVLVAVPLLLHWNSNYPLAISITIANITYVVYIALHYFKKRKTKFTDEPFG